MGDKRSPAITGKKVEESTTSERPEQIIDRLFPPGYIIKNRWQVVGKLGCGGFGQIYLVFDQRAKSKAALKLELSYPAYKCQLPMELQVMKRIIGQPHAAQVIGAGVDNRCNYIVMGLLGPNLAMLRRQCPLEVKRFSTNTSLRICHQGLQSLKDLHSVFIVHRDIKPSNFAMGLPDSPQKDILFVLDFGLARFFAMQNGEVRPPRPRAGFRGTIRYCTINAHHRVELGRGDDLVSLFYMIFESWTGDIPWRNETTHENVQRIKEQNLPEVMAKSLPCRQMIEFAAHIEGLKYGDKPDYDLLFSLINTALADQRVQPDDSFDWTNNFRRLTADKLSSALIMDKTIR